METNTSSREWLPWLGRVRFLIITFLVVVIVAVSQLAPAPPPIRTLIPLIALWYTLAILFVILQRWLPDARWHALVQIVCDLVVITGVVYATRAQDSYFISLYLLAILMGSILFSRRGAFLIAGASFVLLGSVIEFAYYGVIPRTTSSMMGPRALEFWLASNFFAFFAVAYLGSLLTQTVRRKGLELDEKREELKDLQAFNQDIIESMRGGLLTADLEGRILLVNRAGAEITGHGVASLRGKNVADIFPGFWPVEMDERDTPLAMRKEIEFRLPGGASRFLGISISRLRTGQNEISGFVFNFQDLTDMKRLEREVATKEHMAALGRLSAAIAHEIRQPLTAMTGALKELARLAPLDDDDKKLVQIVSRESQRLNQIIKEFLDYSREKTYAFTDVDIAGLIEETLVLLERDATGSGKYRFDRNFAARNIRARGDRDAIKQVCWNLFNNAMRAMPEGGTLTVGLESDSDWVRISVRDTGVGLDPQEATRIFEPFQSHFAGGTGLGLSIVYQIIQAHKGRIRAEVADGQGAVFVVEIPRAKRASNSAKLEVSAEGSILHSVGKG